MKEKKEDIGGGDMLPVGTKDIKELIDNPFELPLLSVFLGNKKSKKAVLTSASIDESGFGPFAILEFDNDNGSSSKYRCSSKPIIDQVTKLLANPANFPVLVYPAVRKNKTGQGYFSLLG